MHSSRMRTGRSLTVCCSLLPGGGCLVRGRVPVLGGVCSQGGKVVPGLGGGGCLLPGGVPGPGGFLVRGVDRHTLVKTLPWPNFVAAGNNITVLVHRAGRTLTSDWSVNRIPKVIIISTRKQSLEQGNVCTGVCLSPEGEGAFGFPASITGCMTSRSASRGICPQGAYIQGRVGQTAPPRDTWDTT